MPMPGYLAFAVGIPPYQGHAPSDARCPAVRDCSTLNKSLVHFLDHGPTILQPSYSSDISINSYHCKEGPQDHSTMVPIATSKVVARGANQ